MGRLSVTWLSFLLLSACCGRFCNPPNHARVPRVSCPTTNLSYSIKQPVCPAANNSAWPSGMTLHRRSVSLYHARILCLLGESCRGISRGTLKALYKVRRPAAEKFAYARQNSCGWLAIAASPGVTNILRVGDGPKCNHQPFSHTWSSL